MVIIVKVIGEFIHSLPKVSPRIYVWDWGRRFSNPPQGGDGFFLTYGQEGAVFSILGQEGLVICCISHKNSPLEFSKMHFRVF